MIAIVRVKMGDETMQPFLEKFGFSSQQDVENSVKLFLTNDHPALTFPYLRPANDIPIGCANLLGSKRDPVHFSPQIEKFLEESAGKDVVYVSFGSYVKVSEVIWYSQLVDILTELDLRVIMRVDKKYDKEFPESVLPLSWAPQKDLLRSGKVKLFISHCGNNGRLETIFYNVPVLCIPHILDQPICAELIKLNRFGESLMAKDVPVLAKDLVAKIISDHGTYQENMKRASDIVENEPGNVRENLVFYVEYLAKFRNVDYLVNNVIKQQNFIEIYNLDIIIPLCLFCLVVIWLTLYALYKIFTYFCIRSAFGSKKNKSD
jgi:glucuronosyltransferase